MSFMACHHNALSFVVKSRKSSTPHPSFQQFCNISNSAIQWRHEARKGLAKKKDNDYLRDLIGRARSLRVIPEELSLLRLRMEHDFGLR